MAESEYILLRRFSVNGDAEAFREIVKQHAPLVYGVCLRILGNKDNAADAVQDTFLQLIREAAEITGSLPNWLHRVAKNRSVELIRQDSSRKQREQNYVAHSEKRNFQKETVTWRKISCCIDEELDKLDELTREVIILHFLEGQTMTGIAEKFGISQPTVSRRIESGIDSLRDKLKIRGVIVPAAMLTALLMENIVQAAPASIIKELGKIAIAGSKAVTGAKISTGISAAGMAVKAKIIATAAIITISIGSVAIYYNSNNTLKAAINTQSPWDLIRQEMIKNDEPNESAKSITSVQTQIGERILHFPKENSIGKLA
ncbi:MAG: sigma-70 family RNA polymerase sigma factor, partial [Sedimentisphaerales bacterium]|nr:sigma-70 family RNA polymerase sigma factor [Sedimentisphaerales bacterium]